MIANPLKQGEDARRVFSFNRFLGLMRLKSIYMPIPSRWSDLFWMVSMFVFFIWPDWFWEDLYYGMSIPFTYIFKTSSRPVSCCRYHIHVPKQSDGLQCGYYVIKYLSEIIESDGLETITSLQSLFNKNSYSTAEIDQVRTEWADCVHDYMYA